MRRLFEATLPCVSFPVHQGQAPTQAGHSSRFFRSSEADLRYTTLKALHVGAALVFAGGVLATAVLLQAARRLALAARPVARVALRWSRAVTTPAMLLVWSLGLVLGIEGCGFRSKPATDSEMKPAGVPI